MSEKWIVKSLPFRNIPARDVEPRICRAIARNIVFVLKKARLIGFEPMTVRQKSHNHFVTRLYQDVT